VQLVSGTLSSAEIQGVLSGRNVAAIGDGFSDAWEVFQFAEAELAAPRTYDLRMRLRGQAGTDGVMPQIWPAGSRFVLLDGRPKQIELAASSRDVERHYRFGLADRPMTDPTYRHRAASFVGNGLRPYPVSHLRGTEDDVGNSNLSWKRRTRLDGDSWIQSDVPLNEASEAYAVRVRIDGISVRELTASSPSWRYTSAMKAADGAGEVVVEVAQISDRFGPGSFRALSLGVLA
jgi:hypothetical protein